MGDAVRLRSRAQWFRQSVDLGWASDSPGEGFDGWMISARTYRNLHESFYGLGPSSRKRSERYADHRLIQTQIRRSIQLPGSAWAQIWVEQRLDIVRGHEPVGDSAPPSPHLDLLTEQGEYGLWTVGLDVGLTSRWAGLQFHLRSTSGDASHELFGVVVDRTWRLGSDRFLTARFMLDRTLESSRDVPYFLLPRLDDRLAPGWDRNRFYGNDRVVMGLVFVQPIFRVLKSHRYEGLVHLGLSQVYDDVAEDFDLRVALGPHRDGLASGAVPLEPTLGIGSRFVALRGGNVIASAMLGFSAEGLQATTFRVTHRLSAWRPSVR